jgi:thioredoxin 1
MSQVVFEMTSENFQETILHSDVPVLVDFTADWCPPCKMIAPFVDELARKYQGKLAVGSLDVDIHPDIQQQYGIMGLPTLVLFHKGEPVKRIVGFQPRERLESQITPYLQLENPTSL